MPELRPAKPQEVQWVLEKLGFELIRQSGSHAVYRHPDGRWTIVPLDIEENHQRRRPDGGRI